MNQNRKRRGFSLIELMIVIAIILIIATIALPKLNRAKMYAHETAAIKTMQTIHTAQTQYQSQFGRFATSLTELGPPQSGTLEKLDARIHKMFEVTEAVKVTEALKGALTVAVVTKPFAFEGKRRFSQAERGLAELIESVDTTIVIPNEKLLAVGKSNPRYKDVWNYSEIYPHILREITHFFSIYKQPEGKHVKVDGWFPREEALAEIDEARQRWAKRDEK